MLQVATSGTTINVLTDHHSTHHSTYPNTHMSTARFTAVTTARTPIRTGPHHASQQSHSTSIRTCPHHASQQSPQHAPQHVLQYAHVHSTLHNSHHSTDHTTQEYRCTAVATTDWRCTRQMDISCRYSRHPTDGYLLQVLPTPDWPPDKWILILGTWNRATPGSRWSDAHANAGILNTFEPPIWECYSREFIPTCQYRRYCIECRITKTVQFRRRTAYVYHIILWLSNLLANYFVNLYRTNCQTMFILIACVKFILNCWNKNRSI